MGLSLKSEWFLLGQTLGKTGLDTYTWASCSLGFGVTELILGRCLTYHQQTRPRAMPINMAWVPDAYETLKSPQGKAHCE